MNINKEKFTFIGANVLLAYIVINYIYLLLGGSDFLNSNLTYIFYTITEGTFNGFLALLLILLFKEEVNIKTIFISFIIGLSISFFSLWETIHLNLNQFHLYPSFLINQETKEVPSSQYARMIALIFIYLFYASSLFMADKQIKIKLSFWLFFATGYFVFFTVGHIFMLKMYDIYREQEKEHVVFLLENHIKNPTLCSYIKSECFIIDNNKIDNLQLNFELRNSLKKNIKTSVRANNFIRDDLVKFLESKERFKSFIDTSLVTESLKYGFLKLNKEQTIILVDTKALTRSSDWYVNLMNVLNLLFLFLWSYFGIKIYKKHQTIVQNKTKK